MALFSRRTVQRLLNKASLIISPLNLQWHLKRLNAKKFNLQKVNDVMASEWELAVLIALSELGPVKHEISCKGSTQLDLFFQSQETGLQFLADVRTVSDYNRHKENPRNHFEKELIRLAQKHHVPANRLNYHVKGEEITSEDRELHTKKDFISSIGPKLRPVTQDSQIKLKLPSKGKMGDYMKQNITPFLRKISPNLNQPGELIIDNNEVSIVLKYDPKQRYFTGRSLSYTVTHSPDRNAIYRALEDKSKQLRKSGFAGIKGVFLCDGDCQLLKDRGDAGLSYSIDDVLWYFFKQDKTIDFVVTITVNEPPCSIYPQAKTGKDICARVFIGLSNHISTLKPQLKLLLEKQLVKYLPPIQRTPANAHNLLLSKNPTVGTSFWGGFTLNANTIKISSRSLQMLLAGEVSFKKFEHEHHGLGPSPQHNIFKNMLHNGRTIKSISVESCPKEDDDWVIIEFGTQDPAISEYK